MEEQGLTKKYGLLTAICMVVGIVIGSGIFYKAETVLQKTGYDMGIGIISWAVGGAVMLACVLAFSQLAARYQRINGVVDYAEATVGKKYAYFVGWFVATMYYPSMTAVVAWVSARYVAGLFGFSLGSSECMMLGALLILISYALNALAPKLAGKFQVSATFIKLVPLLLMIIVGLIVGLVNGQLGQNLASGAPAGTPPVTNPLFGGIVATAFAYEGWIIATSINAEIKNAKRNLPIALIVGSLIVVAVYILYYIGLAGGAPKAELAENPLASFERLFGSFFSRIVTVFIIVSCLGTLNGLMLASVRGFYALAARNEGFRPTVLRTVDKATGIPTNASILGLFAVIFWYVYFFFSNIANGMRGHLGVFSFDVSELPIITVYAFYIPIFILFMMKEKRLSPLRRFVLPALATLGSCVMIAATVFAHGVTPAAEAASRGEFSFPVLFYLIVFLVVMAIGALPFFFQSDISPLQRKAIDPNYDAVIPEDDTD